MISNFDTFFYTVAFVLPGFITYYIVCMVIPAKEEQAQNQILRCLYYSVWNYLLCSFFIYKIVTTKYYIEHKFRTYGIWLIIIFIVSIALGIVILILNKFEIIKKILDKFGYSKIHPIPTSWDYKFSKSEDCYIIVYLKNGSTVAGYFGGDSFASSDTRERDIYIERIYKIENDTEWVEVKRSDGILIKGENIEQIEFFKS